MSEHDATVTSDRRPTPFEHIFVATDFSACAARAVARAGGLPLIEGGRISVAHVLLDHPNQNTRASAEKAARLQLRQAAAVLTESATALGHRNIKVSSELHRGQPYIEIIRHARAAGADLIVLGRHGRRTVKDMLIGSTAERVIRTGDLPILVVSRRATRGYRRPLLAVDLTDTCRSVITVALRVLGPEVAAATMVHVYNVPFEDFITLNATPGELTELRKEYRKTAASSLSKLQASLGDLGIRWQTTIVPGDARTAILAVAARRRTDLIAVGTHGRSGLSHALLGSVAEWVIQAAACDVLVARPARVSFELP